MTNELDGRPVLRALPDDTMHVDVLAPIELLLAPGEPGRINAGLLLQLPAPLGPVRVTLNAADVTGLYWALHTLMVRTSTPEGQAQLLAQIHTTETKDGN
jgi:hypothetical protein